MTTGSPAELSAARTAVARAVKARDVEAERAARSELAAVRLRRELLAVAESGVRVSEERAAELHELVEGVVDRSCGSAAVAAGVSRCGRERWTMTEVR